MRCMGISADGSRCGLNAGYGTDNEYFCHYHDEQDIEVTTFLSEEGIVVGKGWLEDEERHELYHVQLANGERRQLTVSSVGTFDDSMDVIEPGA